MVKNKDTLISTIVVFVSMFTLGVSNLVYTNHLQRQTEDKFCTVVGLVVEAYAGKPPTTPLGLELQRDYVMLYHDLGCSDTNRHSAVK